MDPNAPVIVGVAELTHRGGDAPEPAELMARVARSAAEDSGAGEELLTKLDAIGAIPAASWLDGDPGARAAELLGIQAATLRSSLFGGNGPGLMINTLAQRIQDGRLDAALMCGAEALFTAAQALKTGTPPDWPEADPGRAPGEALEGDQAANTDVETAAGLLAPIMAYPLIENAIGAAAGRTPAEHLRVISDLWSRFSRVAAENPAAWTQQEYTAEQIATASADNRQVSLPYTKLLNSNLQVDQAAAVILTSAATAEALGIDRERWIFLHAGARATDEWFVSERHDLARSPAIRACGEAAFGHAGIGPDDLGPVDLYSCFPSAVQLGANELGLSLDRDLTCTGGLTFFGGPGNNYPTHGVAAVARALRAAEPGSFGLNSALGWYATKHALTVYGNEPPKQPFQAFEPEPDTPPKREVVTSGSGTGETATIIYDRDASPTYGIVFALTPGGERIVAKTDDAGLLAEIESEGFVGSDVKM